jgi:hypothetical protein
MSGTSIHLDTHGTFVKNPDYTLFSTKPSPTEEYIAESYEVPFDASSIKFGDSASALIPLKGDVIRRISVRSTLPELYTPLGPGYVYPSYSDQVDGSIYVQSDTLAIQPGDFTGYFNTQFLDQWATNFVGYQNISVAYDSTKTKFVFTSPVYSSIFFKNENSASFWGFDIRSPDFFNTSGYPAYNFTNGTLTAPLTLIQAGWIRGFTPPPTTGFSYVDSVACKLIKNASLTIGGQTIDRLTSERLIIEDDLGVPYENQSGLTILQGKNDTSTITAPRKYYTRLNFDMDTISMNALKNQEVRVNVEFEEFENLPSNLITTNSLTDGASYTNVNLIPLLYGYQPLYPEFSPRVLNNVPYKNYMIYVIQYIGFDYWFYDTTKPIGLLSSYTKWNDSYEFYAPNTSLTRPYIIGNDMYYSDGSHKIYKVNVNEMLDGTATVTPGVTFFNNKYTTEYFAADPIITSDARYLYIMDTFSMYSIGSNSMTITDINPYVGTSANIVVTANIVTVTATTKMIASDNTAFINFLTNYSPDPVFPANSKITSIKTQNVIASNLVVTANVLYSVGTLPVLQTFDQVFRHRDVIWIRYDTTKPIDNWSSYSYISWTGTTTPKPFFDFIGGWKTDLPVMYPSTDGRYIYSTDITFYPVTGSYINKVDTQNFLTESSYTFFDTTTLNPSPNLISNPSLPLPSDGRYIYFQALSGPPPISGLFRLYRYDSTKNISDPASWTYTNFVDPRFYSYLYALYPLTPVTFDGKYIYYIGPSGYGPNAFNDPNSGPIVIYFSILRYDTTTSSVKDWIVFNGSTNTAATSSGTTTITMTPYGKQDGTEGSNVIANYLGMNVGSRYIYIYQKWGGDYSTWSDFIQFDPLTMSGTNLPTSVIVKYEKYVKPPPTSQISLYGQTDINEFVFKQGHTTDSFPLEFVNPVRELWVVVQDPGVVSRIILRLNNEIIIDDDQVTARYIRAFESHTTMPTSSNVNVYSFSLDPEKLHPSGTLNMSRIAYPVLDVTLESAPTSDLYIRVYSKSFNVLGYQGGLGGLLFNSAL